MASQIDAVTLRRLLLSKQLYTHALEHSQRAGAINKMIAVHNFHNAAEVTLRGILLWHEIRPERELNIDFETLLNLIDQATKFKTAGQRLPYRQELRKLNSVRNLVQHHAHEPEGSTMEEWRVFTHRFLERAFQEYFEASFDEIDGLLLIADPQLQRLAVLSKRFVLAEDWQRAACAAKLAFTFASGSLSALVPDGGLNSQFFAKASLRSPSGDFDLTDILGPVIEKIFARIHDVGEYATIIASGVSASDLRRYGKVSIHVSQTLGGAVFQVTKPISGQDVPWLHDFVVETILKWQSAGLNPRVPEYAKERCESFLEKNEPPGAGA